MAWQCRIRYFLIWRFLHAARASAMSDARQAFFKRAKAPGTTPHTKRLAFEDESPLDAGQSHLLAVRSGSRSHLSSAGSRKQKCCNPTAARATIAVTSLYTVATILLFPRLVTARILQLCIVLSIHGIRQSMRADEPRKPKYGAEPSKTTAVRHRMQSILATCLIFVDDIVPSYA
ncbi:MAG: hypothetical protein Q9187_006576 [Circinaria calcarea]